MPLKGFGIGLPDLAAGANHPMPRDLGRFLLRQPGQDKCHMSRRDLEVVADRPVGGHPTGRDRTGCGEDLGPDPGEGERRSFCHTLSRPGSRQPLAAAVVAAAVEVEQDVAGLGALARADDPAVLQLVHHA